MFYVTNQPYITTMRVDKLMILSY